MELIKTFDGSYTLFNEKYQETYHSIFGARTQSLYVFIKSALLINKKDKLNILEIGFGIGLNALLSAIYSESFIYYETIDNEILPQNILLEYCNTLNYDEQKIYKKIIEAPWNEETKISNYFILKKINTSIEDYQPSFNIDVVFFDLFSPKAQKNVWNEENFKKICYYMNNNAILSTYTANGTVRRILNNLGLKVKKIPGPPFKRHILIAIKV